MLEFNKDHMAADLSAIKPKTKKLKNIGRVVICGIALSSVLVLGGCTYKKSVDNSPVATAIVFQNDNAMLMDLSKYYGESPYGRPVADVYDMDGDRLLLGLDHTIIVTGENSHQKAEKTAENLVGGNGKITYYDEDEDYEKTLR